jgi:hypothetical protein
MNEPVDVDPAELRDFVSGPGPVVLFLSAHPVHVFNRALYEAFNRAEGSAVAFGQVSLADLLRPQSPALGFLRAQVRGSGTAALVSVPPGYYLFRDGRMLAWHLGLPMPGDAKQVFGASMLGLGVAAFMRNLRFFGLVLGYAAENAVAARIVARFREATAAAASRAQDAPPVTPRDELLEAYRILGLDPGASEEELVRAWRELQSRYHPDRAGRDPAEFDRLSRRCVEINRAREVIRKHRRSRGARG